jgi:hypothetical protein
MARTRATDSPSRTCWLSVCRSEACLRISASRSTRLRACPRAWSYWNRRSQSSLDCRPAVMEAVPRLHGARRGGALSQRPKRTG